MLRSLLPVALLVAATSAEAELIAPQTVDPGVEVRIAIVPPLAAPGLLVIERLQGLAGAETVSDTAAAIPLQAGAGEARFSAPGPGSYRLRLEDRGDRATLEVAAVAIRLSVPQEVPAGEPVSIDVAGPIGATLLVRRPGEAVALETRPLPEGVGPVEIRAPVLSGTYDVLLLGADGRSVLLSAVLRVDATRAWLRAPTVVEAGAVLEIDRYGPGGAGHVLQIVERVSRRTVSEQGAGPEGNPVAITLRAPSRPGRYDIVYLSLADGEVLSTTPLVVVD
ncbi:MAG: hypothetical protein ACFBSD_13675 [Paracoccaceae bacterium]